MKRQRTPAPAVVELLRLIEIRFMTVLMSLAANGEDHEHAPR